MPGASWVSGSALVLAQVTAPFTPPPLPRGSLFDRFLLENPWPTAVALVVFAAAVLASSNARGRLRQGLTAAAVCVAAAIGVWVLAFLVETPRERIRQRTADLVRVTVSADVAALDSMLDESVTLATVLSPSGIDKPGILRAVEQVLRGQYAIHDHRVLTTQATIDGPRVARSQVRVRVTPEATRIPHSSWWRIDWIYDGSQWRVTRIEALSPDVAAGAQFR